MSNRHLIIITICLIGLMLLSNLLVVTAAAQSAPLHIMLLDCSGSANETDPHGLGLAALRATVDLLAPAPVGYIPFCGDSLPPGSGRIVDLTTQGARQTLKDDIIGQARTGNTPLADAMQECLHLLDEANAPAGSACWVFTDGQPAPNSVEQMQQIRDDVPAFKSNGWRLYAIAFAGAQGQFADFLEEVAVATGGTAHRAREIEQVQQLFLQIYAQATGRSLYLLTPQQLAGTGGVEQTITVDGSATALTVVAFKQRGVNIKLVAPDDRVVDPGDSNAVLVSDDPYYHLWSLSDPQPGKWRLTASGSGRILPAYFADSTLELKLAAPGPPALLSLGRPMRVEAYFTMRGQRALANPANQAQIQAVITKPSGRSVALRLHDDGQDGDLYTGDGLFSAVFGETDEPGSYNLRLELTTVGGRRSLEGSFALAPFPELHLTKSVSNVRLLPGEDLSLSGEVLLAGKPFALSTSGFQVTGTWIGPDGKPLQTNVELNGHRVTWTAHSQIPGTHRLRAGLSGEYQGVAADTQVEIELDVNFERLAWQLLDWPDDGRFLLPSPALPSPGLITATMTLIGRGQPVNLHAARITPRLVGPDRADASGMIAGTRQDGARLQVVLRPRQSGAYTLRIVGENAEGAPLAPEFEVPINVEFQPLRWQLTDHWPDDGHFLLPSPALERPGLITATLALIERDQPVSLHTARIIPRLVGPDGADASSMAIGTYQSGTKLQVVMRPQQSGTYTLRIVSESTEGIPLAPVLEVPINVEFQPLRWELASRWPDDSSFRLKPARLFCSEWPFVRCPAQTVTVPLILMAGSEAVLLGSADLLPEVHDPNGQRDPDILVTQRQTGSEVTLVLRPQRSGRHSLRLVTTATDGVTELVEPFEVSFMATHLPVTWRDWWWAATLMIGLVLSASSSFAWYNWRRCPRPIGVLIPDGDGAAVSLGAFKRHIGKRSRCVGRPVLDGRHLNLPGLDHVMLRIGKDGSVRVRGQGHGQAAMNGKPLSTWQTLTAGGQLEANGHVYTYQLTAAPPSQTSDVERIAVLAQPGQAEWDHDLRESQATWDTPLDRDWGGRAFADADEPVWGNEAATWLEIGTTPVDQDDVWGNWKDLFADTTSSADDLFADTGGDWFDNGGFGPWS